MNHTHRRSWWYAGWKGEKITEILFHFNCSSWWWSPEEPSFLSEALGKFEKTDDSARSGAFVMNAGQLSLHNLLEASSNSKGRIPRLVET